MPTLELILEFVTLKKMPIFEFLSQDVLLIKYISSFKPKKMHFRHKITYPVFNSICNL